MPPAGHRRNSQSPRASFSPPTSFQGVPAQLGEPGGGDGPVGVPGVGRDGPSLHLDGAVCGVVTDGATVGVSPDNPPVTHQTELPGLPPGLSPLARGRTHPPGFADVTETEQRQQSSVRPSVIPHL